MNVYTIMQRKYSSIAEMFCFVL